MALTISKQLLVEIKVRKYSHFLGDRRKGEFSLVFFSIFFHHFSFSFFFLFRSSSPFP
jgi:hypothetical protein